MCAIFLPGKGYLHRNTQKIWSWRAGTKLMLVWPIEMTLQLKHFVHYIAQSQRDAFSTEFFQEILLSVLMDETMDSGNLEDE